MICDFCDFIVQVVDRQLEVPYLRPYLLPCEEGHVQSLENSGLLQLAPARLEARKTQLECMDSASMSIYTIKT